MSIKIEVSDKHISANGGLFLLDQLVSQTGLKSRVIASLPSLKSGASRSWEKFNSLIHGFWSDAQCLDDMDRLANDDAYQALAKPYTSKSFGDFLRSFSFLQCKQLQYQLIDFSFRLRNQLHGSAESFCIDLDSTSNEQYGVKMEGVEKNYNGVMCLDTIKAFDEFGLPYWMDVRPGNTFSSNGAGEILHAIFSRVPKTKNFKTTRLYSRADSAFCNSEYFNSCANYNVGFVTAMRSNMSDPLINRVKHWHKQNLSSKNRVLFRDGRECEVGETVYCNDGHRETLRVVFIRAEKPASAPLFRGHTEYEYHAFVTNIGAYERSAAEIIQFYRKRGQAENFIKEMKYGFDLKHYPCLKIVANKAYALIAAFSYALMRFLSFKRSNGKVHYAKICRYLFVQLPVQVVRHAGEIVFRYSEQHFEEVRKLSEIIKNQQFGVT